MVCCPGLSQAGIAGCQWVSFYASIFVLTILLELVSSFSQFCLNSELCCTAVSHLIYPLIQVTRICITLGSFPIKPLFPLSSSSTPSSTFANRPRFPLLYRLLGFCMNVHACLLQIRGPSRGNPGPHTFRHSTPSHTQHLNDFRSQKLASL